MLEGSGGNIVVLAGPNGSLMVDVGISVSQQKIRRSLDWLGKAPLRQVVNTHWRWDHTDGNRWGARRARAFALPGAISMGLSRRPRPASR
jgi:glyoxylase-like metal-dependent hydrolase (beta-lactamase superfamily II)